MLQTLLIIVHIAVASAIVGLVLIQHGKGADAGAAFGSGASATVFGARGAASFLTRATAVLATVFFITSLLLAYLGGRSQEAPSVTDVLTSSPAAPELPAAPASTAPADVPTLPGAAPAAGAAGDVPALPSSGPAAGAASDVPDVPPAANVPPPAAPESVQSPSP